MPVVRNLTLPFTYSWQWLTSLPKIFSLPALLLALAVGTYILWFGLETPISFAYSGSNCIGRWTWFPQAQQSLNPHPFTLSYHQQMSWFGIPLVARQSCVKLNQMTHSGSYQRTLSPFGNWLAASRYKIVMPNLPHVSVNALSQPIPLTKPIALALSTADQTFAYVLQANQHQTVCKIVDRQLICALDELDLDQGQTYQFAIIRYFANKPVETVVETQAKILQATTVTETSIKPDQVVLARPTNLIIHFDKSLVTANAEMTRIDSDKPEKVEAKVEVNGKELKLTFNDLPRQAEFEVKVDQLLAQDQSSLVEPYRMRFKTSGGPRVSGISIPQVGVSLGARAVISFDQELSQDQDLASQVTIVGGSATIYRSGNTVVVGLSGVGKCTDFTINVTNHVQSIYGIDGNSAWQYNSRTICHTVEVYGHSVQGRSLLAYVFGEGGTTILFTGAIHGNEISSSYLMSNWINELEANARRLPAGRRIVVIPEVNPDGVAAGTRNNANNVDLNRNYNVSDWVSDITDTYGNPIPHGGGVQPMSEPETKALAAYTSRLRPRLTMSFHSIGGLVIANQAGNSSTLASRYASITGYRNATGQSSQTFEYAISGTYDDWIAERLGLPSVLVELGSHTYSQFPRNKAALWEMARR